MQARMGERADACAAVSLSVQRQSAAAAERPEGGAIAGFSWRCCPAPATQHDDAERYESGGSTQVSGLAGCGAASPLVCALASTIVARLLGSRRWKAMRVPSIAIDSVVVHMPFGIVWQPAKIAPQPHGDAGAVAPYVLFRAVCLGLDEQLPALRGVM